MAAFGPRARKLIAMIPILILAAGASSRLGHPKQLVEFEGETLLHRAARTALAANLGPVLVILGAAANNCRSALADLPVQCHINANFRQGLSTSIRLGVQHVAPPFDSVILMLADQPLITSAHLQSLAAACIAPYQAAATLYDDDVGVPAAFHPLLVPQLLTLQGDYGAKQLLRQRRHLVTAIPLPGAALDIDTPSDAVQLQSSPTQLKPQSETRP